METVPVHRGEKGFRGTPAAQAIGMAAAFAVCILLLSLGRGPGSILLLFSGIMVYVVLRLFGVRKPKTQLAFGAVLVVTAVLIGGMVVSPAYIDATGKTDGFDNAGFSELSVVDNGNGTHTFSVRHAAGATVHLHHGEMTSVGYRSATHGEMAKTAMAEASGTYSATLALDGGKLYVYGFSSEPGDGTYQLSYPGAAADSDVTGFSLKWNAYYVGINFAFAFFLVVILVAWMRKRMDELRERMEEEGRLFPPGYGRCATCGNLILPGMYECRKCGTPVPEELLPKAKKMFECSECGASVGEDDTVCPGCGASFDDDGDCDGDGDVGEP